MIALTDAARRDIDRRMLELFVEHHCRMHDADGHPLTGPFKWDGDRITAEVIEDGVGTQVLDGDGAWVAGFPVIIPVTLSAGGSVSWPLA